MSQATDHRKPGIPPRPKQPDPYECCGRGCGPCIHDYHARALARWEQRVAELKKGDLD